MQINPKNIFFTLSLKDKLLCLRAGILLSFFSLALKLLPFTSLYRWLLSLASMQKVVDEGFTEKVVWVVNGVSWRLPWKQTCLIRSMAVYYLLKKAGCSAKLIIGVEKNANQFKAHAWVEDGEGQVVAEDLPELYNYLPLTSLSTEQVREASNWG